MKTQYLPILSANATERRAPIVKSVDPIRLKPIGAVLGGILIGSVLALSPSPVQAQCAQWNVRGNWVLQQNNGFAISMDLRQSGKAVTGSASYGFVTDGTRVLGVKVEGGDPATRNGSVNGNIEGDDFYMTIRWDVGTTGIYRGKVGRQGRLDGTTYDQGKSSNRATWFSDRAMNCGETSSAAPGPIRPGAILKTGKAPTSAPALAPTATTRPIKRTGKAPTAGAASAGVPRIVVFNKPGQPPGTQTLTWDGGPDHPYAEVWVKVDGGDETKVVEQGKGMRQVTVQPGKTYQYILTDSGQQLGSTTAVGK